MSVTPNFSWPLIQPTDFVTDLPADLEALADDIDADVWAIKGTADAALPETIIDAAGDLIYGSAADTAARLAIGTAGQVLTVNSGATAPEWKTATSGGMTLITSGTLSGASVALTSIPGTYKNLQLIIRNFQPATDGARINGRFNNDSNNRYNTVAATATGLTFGDSYMGFAPDQDNTTATGLTILDVFDYANTATWKVAHTSSITNDASSPTTNFNWNRRYHVYNQTGAITEINLIPSSGNFTSGNYFLYGVQ